MRLIIITLFSIIILITLCFGCIGNNTSDKDRKQFSFDEGYPIAIGAAKEWNNDPVFVEVISKDARQLDGRNYEWKFDFRAPNTIKNITDINEEELSWSIERLVVTIKKVNDEFQYSSENDIWTMKTPYLLEDLYQVNTNISSGEAVVLAKGTTDVKDFLEKSDTMWVDYRLTRTGWTINIDSVESNAYREGIAVVVNINPATNEVKSRTEGQGAD